MEEIKKLIGVYPSIVPLTECSCDSQHTEGSFHIGFPRKNCLTSQFLFRFHIRIINFHIGLSQKTIAVLSSCFDLQDHWNQEVRNGWRSPTLARFWQEQKQNLLIQKAVDYYVVSKIFKVPDLTFQAINVSILYLILIPVLYTVGL